MRLGILTLGTIATAAFALEARDALACGGCFAPPEVNTVVTDHRMAFVLSNGQTTLYDQIKYQGSPSAFAWVLPIAGTAEVGLSADVVFATLDAATATTVIPPPTNCYVPTGCFRAPSSFAAGAEENGGGGVTVTKQEVVGPYLTVQLKASDPVALDNWLASNGFQLPDAIKPLVAAYVNEKFDFLAMKLVPGASVQSMRPVRVTTQGATPTLPLRMVAAGTGATVGITLWVIGDGRYEPQNFPFFHIEDSEIAWDWSANRSNFSELRAQKAAPFGGRGWEIESSLDLSVSALEDQIRNGGIGVYGNGFSAPPPSGPDYAPTQTMTADQVREADLKTLFGTHASVRITRMRSDVAHSALDQDLVLRASSDQRQLSNTHRTTSEIGQPQCPIYDGCTNTGKTAPRDVARDLSTGAGARGGGCGITPKSGDAPIAVAIGALGAIALVLRARRRR
jgi:hypothetical protein